MNSNMEKELGYRKVFIKAGRTVDVSQQIEKIRLHYSGAGKRDIVRIQRKPYSVVQALLLKQGYKVSIHENYILRVTEDSDEMGGK